MGSNLIHRFDIPLNILSAWLDPRFRSRRANIPRFKGILKALPGIANGQRFFKRTKLEKEI
jgi:hypothetical protein